MKKVFISCAIFILGCVSAYSGHYEDGVALLDGGNDTAASQKFKMACDGKHYEACDKLARLYMDGKGVRKNAQKSISLYDRACKEDLATSCSSLGGIYAKGNDVKRDAKKAVKYYERACELEDEKSCENAKTLIELMQKTPNDVIIRNNVYIKNY